MKKLAITSVLSLSILLTFAQQPFEAYGYKVRVATLSQGKYVEFFDQDTLAQIGSVIINTHSGKIVSFVADDTTYSEATLHAEVISRWISPDPLSDQRWSFSPYNFVQNNPVIRIDPTGALDDYAMNTETGEIKLTRRTDEKTDKLVDASDNSKVIAKKVSKGLLKNGQNIKKNGLQTKNVEGGIKLAVSISMYTHEEVSGGVYKNEDNKFLVIQPYEGQEIVRGDEGDVIGMNSGASPFDLQKKFTSTDGSFTGEISSYFHTHPGHPDGPTLGNPKPSLQDLNNAVDNKILRKIDIVYYIYGKYQMTSHGNTSNMTGYRVNKNNLPEWRLLKTSWSEDE
ncbi:MAG TPA: hypothetical protein VIM75_03530 [Ohtaekwangia sp.]|uniref:hypothetical protein n=1 Tax=Ohtaekwangia sp. TaxID=2066019 RepID=UPI002F92B7F5